MAAFVLRRVPSNPASCVEIMAVSLLRFAAQQVSEWCIIFQDLYRFFHRSFNLIVTQRRLRKRYIVVASCLTQVAIGRIVTNLLPLVCRILPLSKFPRPNLRYAVMHDRIDSPRTLLKQTACGPAILPKKRICSYSEAGRRMQQGTILDKDGHQCKQEQAQRLTDLSR